MRIQKLLIVAALVAAPMALAVGPASAAPAAPVAPTFVITPNPAVPGDNVVFSGTGCVGQDSDPTSAPPQVTLYVVDAQLPARAGRAANKKFAAGDDGGNPVVTPNPDGTWSYSLPLPDQYPSLKITFGAVCDTYTGSFQYTPVTLTINGNVDLGAGMFLPDFLTSTPVLHAGLSYTVDAYGFEPGEKVDLLIHSTPVQIATFVADEDGLIDEKTFTVPVGTIGGAHTLELVGEDSDVTTSLPIEVIAAPATTTVTATVIATTTVSSTPTTTPSTTTTSTTASGPVLASTGTTAAPQMTAVGLLLTLGGVGTLLFARRRGSRSH